MRDKIKSKIPQKLSFQQMDVRLHNICEKVTISSKVLDFVTKIKISHRWMKDIFKLGLKGTISLDQTYKPKSSLESNRISTKFIKLWAKELKNDHPSVVRVIYKMYGFPLIILGVMFSIVETSMR